MSLMTSSDSEDRREAPRQPCSVRFSYFYRGQRREAMMANVSRVGAFLDTSAFPPPGSIVLLESFHDAARGLIVRFVVQVIRAVDTLETAGRPGIGVAWRRAYCNRGALALAAFVGDQFAFDLPAEAAIAADPALSEREVFYDFQEQVFRLRTPHNDGRPRHFHHPTPRSFMLIRDLPPADLPKPGDVPVQPSIDEGQLGTGQRLPRGPASRPTEPPWRPSRSARTASRSDLRSADSRSADSGTRRVPFQDEPIWPVRRPAAPAGVGSPLAAPAGEPAEPAAAGARGADAGMRWSPPATPDRADAPEDAGQPDVATGTADWSSAPFRIDEVARGTSPGMRGAEAAPRTGQPIVEPIPPRASQSATFGYGSGAPPWQAPIPPPEPAAARGAAGIQMATRPPARLAESPPGGAPDSEDTGTLGDFEPSSASPDIRAVTSVITGAPEERAPAKIGVTYSVGNRHFTGFTSHVGERSLRIVTRESAPETGTRIVVRLPIPRHVGYHIARLSCRVISVESDPLESGGPTAFDLQVQVIDDAGNPGGFRKFVRELVESRKA